MHPSEAHVLSSVVEPNLSSVKFLLWQSVHVLLHCVLGILSNIFEYLPIEQRLHLFVSLFKYKPGGHVNSFSLHILFVVVVPYLL